MSTRAERVVSICMERVSGILKAFARLAGLAVFAVLPAAAHGGELQALLGDLEGVRQRHSVPAMALTLVSRDGTIYSGAAGVENVVTGKPASTDTLFRIGSITKTFTSLAILVLQEDGLLALDDPVRVHAPDAPYTNAWEDSHPVRIAHLLEHTAGFNDLLQAEWDHNDPTPVTLEQALAFRTESRVARWPPGTHSSYSNSGAGLAGYVLERVTDERYEDFVRRRLFAPLGMESAGFFLDEASSRRLATGYEAGGETVIPYWHMIFRPFGGINVSPPDMAPFLRLLLNEGRHEGSQLLRPESIHRLETPATTLAARAGLRFGYGLGNYAWTRDGSVWHGHGGDGDGYLAHYGYSRDVGSGYFVVITAFDHAPLRAMRARIESYLLRGFEPLAAPRRHATDAQTLRLYVGLYEPATYRFPWSPPDAERLLRITLADGILFTRSGGGESRQLLPVSDQLFRRPHEPVATAAFLRDVDGRVILQGGMGNYRKLEPRSGDETAPSP